MCLHTTVCPHTTIGVSSYYYIRVLMLLGASKAALPLSQTPHHLPPIRLQALSLLALIVQKYKY
jgi:hypothetical protein